MMGKSLDQEIDMLVARFGISEVIAAVCRYCDRRGLPALFQKLSRIYEWLKK